MQTFAATRGDPVAQAAAGQWLLETLQFAQAFTQDYFSNQNFSAAPWRATEMPALTQPPPSQGV